MIIADNVVGNGESGLALANSSGLIVVRNFIGVDRKGGNQGNLNEGIDVQQTGVGKRPQNVLVSDNTISFNALQGIIVSNADRTTVTGNIVSDNGEGISIDGDHNVSAQATASTTTSPRTRGSRCTAVSATRSPRTRSTGTRASGSTSARKWRHSGRRP